MTTIDLTTPAAGGTSRPVSVGELRRAWTAVQAGDFRQARDRDATPPRTAAPGFASSDTVGGGASVLWAPNPGERVVPVIGSAGSVGASTVALAIATVAVAAASDAVRCRVVECCSATSSGLAAATTAELGRHQSGWVRGTRGPVLLERVGGVLVSAGQLPTPVPFDDHPDGNGNEGAAGLTVLDTGWEAGQLLAAAGWLGDAVRRAPTVVVVARPTIPGFRRLEATLELLERGCGLSTVLAVVGPRRRKWVGGVEHSAAPRTRTALREDRFYEIPDDRHLAVAGLASTPLPPALLAGVERLLTGALGLAVHQELGSPLVPGSQDHGTEPSVEHDVDTHLDRVRVEADPVSTRKPSPDADTLPGTGTNLEGIAR